MQVVKKRSRESSVQGNQENGRNRSLVGWQSFVMSEVVATHHKNFEVKEWASKFCQTLSKAKSVLTFLEFG